MKSSGSSSEGRKLSETGGEDHYDRTEREEASLLFTEFSGDAAIFNSYLQFKANSAGENPRPAQSRGIDLSAARRYGGQLFPLRLEAQVGLTGGPVVWPRGRSKVTVLSVSGLRR